MVRRPNTTAQGKMKTGNSLRKVGYPREVDWRNSCVVTRAKNQGSCGACWAFSTVANAESYLNLLRETNYDLSEEYVLECTQSSDCSGGYP
jgi:C1A family cysteine protease